MVKFCLRFTRAYNNERTYMNRKQERGVQLWSSKGLKRVLWGRTENKILYSRSKGSIHTKTTPISWTYSGSKNGNKGGGVFLLSNKGLYRDFPHWLWFSTLQATIMPNTKIIAIKADFSSLALFDPFLSRVFSNFNHGNYEIKFWKKYT